MIVDTVFRQADARPEAIAVAYNGQNITYARFAAMLAASMAFFGQFGFDRGRTAAVVMDNLLLCWLAVHALRALGFNTITVASPDQIPALGVTDVCCLVYAASEQRGEGPAVGTAVRLVTFPDAYITQATDVQGERPTPDGRPGGHYIYTSGTTGNYKVLLAPGDMVESNAPDTMALYGLGPETRFGGLYFPLYTGAALVSIAAWMAGSCVVLDQRADALLRLMTEGVDVCMLVPAMLEKLLRELDANPTSRAAFRLFTIGGAISSSLAERVANRITPNIDVQYGSSECGALARSRYRTVEDLVWLTPEPGRELIIVAPDGSECEPGQEGELAVRLGGRDRTYYVNDPESTARFFRDGWFYPGDMAVRREDGRIRILGRTADVLNIMGFKRAVGPIEEEIRRLLGAREVCLFGSMSEGGEELLHVAIEADGDPTSGQAEAIRSKFPRRRVTLRVLAQFPRGATAMQKIDRRALRRLVVSSTGR